MKVLERILDGLIRQLVPIDDSKWLRPRQRQNRCNLCCKAAAREVFSCQQETLHVIRRLENGRPQREVQVGPDKLEVVASFCHLGDMLSAADGCELSTTTRVKITWKKFNELLPVLYSCHLSFKTRGRVYSSCLRSAMLHVGETWPLTKPNLQRLQRNDRAMIRQICNVRPQDIVTTRSNVLLARLGIEDLDLILKERIRWYGHVEHSSGEVDSFIHTG